MWMPCAGSPPRVRGEVELFHDLDLKLRITPACAGRRLSESDYLQRRRITPACAGRRLAGMIDQVTMEDHPRVCGEKSIGSVAVRV